jgi:hypothetical protein
MASSYAQIAADKSYVEANQSLYRLNERLKVRDLNLSWSPEEIKSFAADKACLCRRIGTQHAEYQTFNFNTPVTIAFG